LDILKPKILHFQRRRRKFWGY